MTAPPPPPPPDLAWLIPDTFELQIFSLNGYLEWAYAQSTQMDGPDTSGLGQSAGFRQSFDIFAPTEGERGRVLVPGVSHSLNFSLQRSIERRRATIRATHSARSVAMEAVVAALLFERFGRLLENAVFQSVMGRSRYREQHSTDGPNKDYFSRVLNIFGREPTFSPRAEFDIESVTFQSPGTWRAKLTSLMIAGISFATPLRSFNAAQIAVLVAAASMGAATVQANIGIKQYDREIEKAANERRERESTHSAEIMREIIAVEGAARLRIIQGHLFALGLYADKIDGIWGPNTLQAANELVRRNRYQRNYQRAEELDIAFIRVLASEIARMRMGS